MPHLLFVIAKLCVVVLGLLIAYQAYRGYQRNGSERMRYVAVGFVLISVGGVLEGLLFEVLSLPIFQAGFAATLLMVLGMVSILYALYGPST